jgi:hypothetical protein
MAAPQPRAERGRPETGAARGSGLWLQGLVCGGVLAVAAPAVLLVVVLGLPALLAWASDREPGRPMARNVMLFAAALSVPALAALWQAGRGWSACLDLLSEPERLAAAWAAQAGAWLLGELAPLVLRLGMDAASRAQTTRLRARRARLEAEWGLPPPEAPPAD